MNTTLEATEGLEKLFLGDLAEAFAMLQILPRNSASKVDPAVLGAMDAGQAILTARYSILAAEAALRIKTGAVNMQPDETPPQTAFVNELCLLDIQDAYANVRMAEIDPTGSKQEILAAALPRLKDGFANAAALFRKAVCHGVAAKVEQIGGIYAAQISRNPSV